MKKEREFLERAPKAYKNEEFLNDRSARPLRIMAEYMYPEQHFSRWKVQNTVIFFGSARVHSPETYAQRESELKSLLSKAKGEEKKKLKSAVEQLKKTEHYIRYYNEAAELSGLITEWSLQYPPGKRYVVCSGGGPGIMEAANRGAHEVGGESIGLNISLPFEQYPNRYISPYLNFEFHYFFMRKYWFTYFAKAMVVFPGGFGTMDELFELLTLVQTEKITRPLIILLYGKSFWEKIVNFEALVEAGMISPEDLELFRYVDAPQEAFEFLRDNLMRHTAEAD